MSGTVVILSCPQDYHAHAMCEALERKGAQALFLYTPDFPERSELTIDLNTLNPTLVSNDCSPAELDERCRSVWLRRPYLSKAPEDFEDDDRKVIESECREMLVSFLNLLAPTALWVNPLQGLLGEHCKPAQLLAARQCGLAIPPTLISNNPHKILTFVRKARGRVVYKTFNSLVPTSIITPELLSEPDELRWTPGIYQHYIEKDHELRVTAIGRRLFTVRINSQQTARGKIDWREAQWQPRGGSSDLALEPVTLPVPIQHACQRLMAELGLAYGAIDLVVTPDERYMFLELNPSGQFLWIDYETRLPLLDAMAEMLIQGRVDYAWDRRSVDVWFDAEFLEAVEARRHRSMADHVCDLRSWWS